MTRRYHIRRFSNLQQISNHFLLTKSRCSLLRMTTTGNMITGGTLCKVVDTSCFETTKSCLWWLTHGGPNGVALARLLWTDHVEDDEIDYGMINHTSSSLELVVCYLWDFLSAERCTGRLSCHIYEPSSGSVWPFPAFYTLSSLYPLSYTFFESQSWLPMQPHNDSYRRTFNTKKSPKTAPNSCKKSLNSKSTVTNMFS